MIWILTDCENCAEFATRKSVPMDSAIAAQNMENLGKMDNRKYASCADARLMSNTAQGENKQYRANCYLSPDGAVMQGEDTVIRYTRNKNGPPVARELIANAILMASII